MKLTLKTLISSPLFAPLWPALRLLKHHESLPSISDLNELLNIHPIQFVPQSEKTDDFESGYEPRIYLRGEVQTRVNSWHDFFNALVWQQFPQSKKMINQLHYELQKQRHPNKQRLPAENMLTLFDENGAIVIAQNPDLLELIKQHRWHELFWQKRDEVKEQLQIFIIGHGLYEKSVRPYIGLTAQSLLFVGENPICVDTLTSEFLNSQGVHLQTAVLNPLPILGIPGWWSDNENEAFYFNKNYFRD